ncbi:MATE family efflux transporter [Fusobacteria bacterium ZRK30]|nr:MATE family efflux transporter [Fusobacteria bacterium ZRK30]
MDLRKDPILKLFLNYLLPSVAGTLSVGILIFIDTLFIGRGIGSLGLAALTTAVPMFTLYSSIGLLLGMGGATVGAIELGRGKKDSLKIAFTNALLLAVGLSVVLTIIQQFFLRDIVNGLGATPEIYSMVRSYLNVISLFTCFYLIPHTMNLFIRNDNNPNLAMIGMMVCGVTNIVLDYIFIFIFKWGMIGAAAATGIAQLTYTLVLATHFISSKNTLRIIKDGIDIKILKRIVKIGFPSFITDAFGGIVIFLLNGILFKLSGSIGVSAYAIILNINWMIYLLYLGISQASQPIISINYGSNLKSRLNEMLKIGAITSFCLGILIYIGVVFYREELVNLFVNENKELTEVATNGFPLFFIAIIFMGFNLFMGTYFQAVEQTKISMFVMFLRGLGVTVLLLYPMARFYGIEGVWLTLPFAEMITTGLIIWWIKKKMV